MSRGLKLDPLTYQFVPLNEKESSRTCFQVEYVSQKGKTGFGV